MKNTLYQVSTMDSLMQGWFSGVKTLGAIRENGDTGIGTFEGADGELIAVDGKFYKAMSDGRVALASDDEKLPFACVAEFDTEWITDISLTTTLGSLEKALSGVLDNFNHFYMARLDGFFQSVTVRVLVGCVPPYPTLREASKRQRVFTGTNLRGSVVSLYTPSFAKGCNLPGWHTHFVSADRKIGGHVVDLSLASGKAAFTRLCSLNMELPKDIDFGKLDLTKDMSADTHAVEK
ncbi:MAG: acetolactate decarboxylase [Clostridia bacterium]|nr:acetolactate decarboxylase [Clostridia bacterium]